jgi:hypothetical protein
MCSFSSGDWYLETGVDLWNGCSIGAVGCFSSGDRYMETVVEFLK